MDDFPTTVMDFGCVPCGVKVVETFKYENNTKKTQLLEVCHELRKFETLNELILNSKLHIQPTQVELHPKQTACFKLTYYSHVEDVEDNFSYNFCDSEKVVAHLIVRAKTVGPSLNPKTFNIKFFRFRNVNQTVKYIEITNTAKREAKFYFDMDEGHRYFEFSQTRGVIPGDLKFGMKVVFNPIEPGVYYKKIFCIIQFHKPLIFNLIAVYKPKLSLDPKNINLKYPRVLEYTNSYEAFMRKQEFDKLPDEEKTEPLQKCLESLDLGDLSKWTEGRPCVFPPPGKTECTKLPEEIFLTTSFIDVKNSYEVPAATSIINISKCVHYYYEWDCDPEDHFHIAPYKGLIKPNSKVDFAINFTPSASDRLYHIEMDVKIFLCNVESKKYTSAGSIELPLTRSLRIIGHSFPESSCGWVPQCKITPKILHLRACVPDERIYGIFTLMRDGHLPVTYSVVPAKDPNFTVRPPLGYLSKDFQLFVVQFNSSSKHPGTYTEDLKIKFNKFSDENVETIKVVTSVELPRLVFGFNNKALFSAVFPWSRVNKVVPITNPTRLQLHYEFLIPEHLTWLEIENPTGSIGPRGNDELKLIFKPVIPCEYMDYVLCRVSSAYKPDYFEEIQLQVVGSCQYGYLVATPSIYDFGKAIYKKETTIEIHLFNFSFVLLFFRLKAINSSYPPGDAETDVTLSPSEGKVPPKASIKIEVCLKTQNLGYYEYTILCQNVQDSSKTAKPCEDPRKIILLRFEGVLPHIRVKDLSIQDAGPLFSSHTLWKMMRIDQLNEALQSLKPREVIRAKIPEAVRNSKPITLAFLIETKHDKLMWQVNIESQSPCYVASSLDFTEECWHAKTPLAIPTKYLTEVSKTTALMLMIHYHFFNESLMSITISLPYRREVVLEMPMISLPTTPPTYLSFYLNPTFCLSPVFIGDRQPPLQLFWLYNNTESPASYSLDMKALCQGPEQKVFDCINPEGVIPPYSSHPLGIIFSPNEIMTYKAEVPLNLGRHPVATLTLIGEGVLNVDPLNLIYIKNYLPKSPIIKNGEVRCCENYINIPFLGVHSQTFRIFFLENTSSTDKWCFKWTDYTFENIFRVSLEPAMGVIEPGQKVLISMSVKTYGYPSSISFSISCETINHNQQTSYKESVRRQEIIAEREKEEFIITDGNKEKYREPEPKIPKVAKPVPQYIFVTVNVNILSDAYVEELLNKKLPCCSKATKEIYTNSDLKANPLTPPMIQFVQTFLEKLLWDTMFHQRVLGKLKFPQKSQDFTYKQMLPQTERKKETMQKLLAASPSKRFVQEVLDSTALEIIFKNFIPKS